MHNILEFLRESCSRFPEKTALADETVSLTYRELWDRAAAVGACLSSRLAGKRNRPVAVCIGRDADSAAAFLGVAASGNFYVPVDPALPAGRLERILSVTGPELILGRAEDAERLPASAGRFLSFKEAAAKPGDPSLIEHTIETSCSTDPLYCIFTSGSTGVPKGVLVSHGSVINMTEQFHAAFGFDENTVFGNQAPFDFDVSVKDLYNGLARGAAVQILERRLFLSPKRLMERLDERRVNTLIWAASAMKIVSALKTFDVIVPQHLRLVMFSGEALPCRVLNDWADHLPEAKFVNLYGPTEITCNCTYYKIDRRFSNEEALPIGRAFPNTEVFLLDGNRAVSPGETGELCVRGVCLALGYYNDPERTAAAFPQDPRNGVYPQRIYRTGDLARQTESGDLIFLGRADSQVKHMGHRIELGEIEVAANSLSCLVSACCLYDHEREKLCLFYQADRDCDREIAAGLKELLPQFMIPGKYIRLDKMPENRTGKIDRVLLRERFIAPSSFGKER